MSCRCTCCRAFCNSSQLRGLQLTTLHRTNHSPSPRLQSHQKLCSIAISTTGCIGADYQCNRTCSKRWSESLYMSFIRVIGGSQKCSLTIAQTGRAGRALGEQYRNEGAATATHREPAQEHDLCKWSCIWQIVYPLKGNALILKCSEAVSKENRVFGQATQSVARCIAARAAAQFGAAITAA